MKKLNQVASLISVAAVAAFASSGAFAQTVDNWRATDGTVWKNGTNELCWRDANWTPATAAAECDGALKPAPKAAPAPAPAPAPCRCSSCSSEADRRASEACEREGHLRC